MSSQHKEEKALKEFTHRAAVAICDSNTLNNLDTINGIADMLAIAIDSRNCKFGPNGEELSFYENLNEANKQLKDFLDRRANRD